MASKDGLRLRQLDVTSIIVDSATRARSFLMADPLITSTALGVFDCSARFCGAELILPIEERELRPEEIGYISAKLSTPHELNGSMHLINGLFGMMDGSKVMTAVVSDQARIRRGSHVEKLANYVVEKLNSGMKIPALILQQRVGGA